MLLLLWYGYKVHLHGIYGLFHHKEKSLIKDKDQTDVVALPPLGAYV